MIRIDELNSPPVVGRFYLVPTVRYHWLSYVSDWPVIGPKHSDAEILKFDWPHYHVDGRFLTQDQWRMADDWKGDVIWTLAHSPLLRRSASDRTGHDPHPPVVYLRKRCSRSRVGYMVDGASSPDDVTWIPKLRAAFAGDCLRETDTGRVCPHKGAHLGSIAPNADGHIVCPLHGLRFDAATGRSVG